MDTQRLQPGATASLRFLILGTDGSGVDGLSPGVSIVRDSDGKFFNGVVFQTAPATLAMSEVSATDLPGVYEKQFDQSVDNTQEGYLVHYTESTLPASGIEQLNFIQDPVAPTTTDIWSAPSRTLTSLGSLLSQVVNQAIAVARPTSSLDGFLQFPARDGTDGAFNFSDEIDIRAEMDKTLRERGHKVLIRKPLDQRCPKWDPDRNDAHPEACPHCWGGWAYKDIWVLTYRRPAFGPAAEGLTDEFRSIFGEFSVRHNLFYFKHDVAPSPRDGIIEVELDDSGEPKRAVRIARVWDIGIVHPFRDQFGRVEYWIVSAEERKLGK